MTVIATDGLTIAADRQVSIGDEIAFYTCKLHVAKDYLLAIAGPSTMHAYIEWFQSGARPEGLPIFDERYYEIMVIYNNTMRLYSPRNRYGDNIIPSYAFGSGGEMARTAMRCGLNPIEAVEFTNQWHGACGGGVDIADITPFYKRP